MWRRGILVWEEESVRECSFLLNNVVLQDNVTDNLKWLLEPIQGYSARVTYHILTTTHEVFDGGRISNVWHKVVPSKISVFAWRLLRNRIPTKTNLLRRGVLPQNDTMCVGGCGCPKTAIHLFIACDIFCSTWSFLWRWLGIDFVPPGAIVVKCIVEN